MTTPGEENPRTEPAATPSVTTAPPRARWRFGTVPSHLGRARTSTVVLLVLFAAVFVLWVYVRPDPTGTTTGGTGGVPAPVAPASTAEAPAPTTETTPPTSEPTTTTPAGTTTEESSTSVGETSGEPPTSTSGSSPTTTRPTTTVDVPSTTTGPTT